jgi:hypothetical protein
VKAYKVGQIGFETNFLNFVLRAADVRSLEFFEVISFQFFTTFPTLLPLFKTVFKILNRIVCQNFFTDDLMSSRSEKLFPFSTLFEFWKQPEVSWSEVRRVRRMIHGKESFLLKTATLESKNVAVRCRGEESMSDLSTTLLACASRHQ